MLLKLEKISKSYYNSEGQKHSVLLDLNFELNNGGSVAIVGPSGCGKSTFLNIIGSLDHADDGQIIFDGKDISKKSEKELLEFRKDKIGFVFQQHHLLPQLNMLENILLPFLGVKDRDVLNKAKKKAEDLIKHVGLDNHKNHFPDQMSVGECQRVAVIRALINEPDLLLADEPTGSLDEDGSRKLVTLLKEININYGLSIIMVTHSSELATYMDKTYMLNNGSLDQIG